MERYRIILSALLAAGAVGLSGAAVYTSLTAVPALSVQPLAETAEQTVETAEDTAYLLVAEEGRLCVYQGGELVMRTDIPVSLLPEADRADLEAGIRAESRQELAALLEDLGA